MAFLSALAPMAPQIIGGLGAYKASRVKPQKKAPAIPMPDDEEIQRAKRRSAPASRGRASTILTGTDYGLGG
jgi:hypothetical protein